MGVYLLKGHFHWAEVLSAQRDPHYPPIRSAHPLPSHILKLMNRSSHHEEEKKLKILALDGGGIRGVVTATILQEVEALVGQPLHQYFDFIAGTSTGSILAAGLALGMEPKELRKVYQERGREIFKSGWSRKTLSWLWGSKYKHEGLIKVVREEFRKKAGEDITFGQVDKFTSTELLIFAYDTLYCNTTCFTSRPPKPRWYHDMKLWEICAASASAPTFFPPYEFKWTDPNDPKKQEWSYPHVDGGVSSNCPGLAALGHVLALKKTPLKDISILSIGTGRTTHPIQYEQMKKWGKLWWGSQIVDVFMEGQIQLATDTCAEIINSVNSPGYLRLQFDLNQVFRQRKTLLSPPPLLEEKERVNSFIHEKISEAMDDASQENIERLIDAATKFTDTNTTTIQEFLLAQQKHSGDRPG